MRKTKLEKIEQHVSDKNAVAQLSSSDRSFINTLLEEGSDDMVSLATGAYSLAEKPGKNNWIEHASDYGLPLYIARIAKALIRSGHPKSRAIAIAISRVKVWAAGGGGVNADTRAKAAKAVAEWEALKAKSKAKKAVKK